MIDIKLPVDTVVKDDKGNHWHYSSSGNGFVNVFDFGRTSKTADHYFKNSLYICFPIDEITICENPYRYHDGSEQPVSDWVRVDAGYIDCNGEMCFDLDIPAFGVAWCEIIVYKIIEQEIPQS